MRFPVAFIASSVLGLLIASACGGDARPDDARVAITSFRADPARVRAGEAVNLTWTATGGTSVELTDENGTPLEFTGGASSGSAKAHPLGTSFYVLTVSGEGGRVTDAVRVVVEDAPEEVSLVAAPPVVDSGGTVQLLWAAVGATNARIETLEGQTISLGTTGREVGVVEVTPDRTVGYTLVAFDRGTERTSTVEVKVRPVIGRLRLQPEAAHVGEVLRFDWRTAGASALSISEATWGVLHTVTFESDGAAVDEGSFDWSIPAALPDGEPVVEGMPLRFTVEVTQDDPAVTLTRELFGYVGDGPVIEAFLAPDAVTVGDPVRFEWRTVDAVSVTLFANGLPIRHVQPSQTERVQKGSYTLPALGVDTEFQLVATSQLGASSSATRTVAAVAAPQIQGFTLTPVVGPVGDAATAAWTTRHATTVVLRAKQGATVYASSDVGTVLSGTTQVHPGLRTTFELVAYNAAGASEVRAATVEVQSPGSLVATPSPVTPGETVSVSWTIDPAVTAQLVGDPRGVELRTNPASSFLELRGHPDARRVEFDDPDDGVRALTFPEGFAFPFLGTTNAKAWVSTDGFVSFTATVPDGDNVPLDSAAHPLPSMIAPFWDDLNLGVQGQVLSLLEAGAFPRRMILQWDRVETDSGSALTFQLQLLETGEFRFVYPTLSGTDALGESASIGWRLNATRAKELAGGGAVVAPGDEIRFFSAGATTGAYEVAVDRKGAFTLFGRLTNGAYVLYSAPVNVIAPGSVHLNEAMIVPDALAPAGQWIELYNEGAETVDLEGTVLSAGISGSSYTLPAGLELPPGGYLVIGASTNPQLNGGARVDHAWSGFAPSTTTDESLLLTAHKPLSALNWTSAEVVPAQSILRPERAIDSTGFPIRCPRTETFGPGLSVGTPGAPNERCYPYELTRIPVNYVDISVGGTPVLTAQSRYLLDLSAAPFPYFGQPLTQLTVMKYGYFTGVDPSPTSTSSNKAKPSSKSPVGTIAPYWEYLTANGNFPDSGVYVKRLQDHWVIQYHHMRGVDVGTDDINLQAKLFDDGVIEFHYAAMISGGTTGQAASGLGATTWIENPTGASALPVGIDSQYMESNVAWRFSPR